MPLNLFAGKWQIFGLYSIEFLFLPVLHPRTARLMDERAEKVGLLTHNTASRTFKSNPHVNTAFSDPGAEKKPSPSCLGHKL